MTVEERLRNVEQQLAALQNGFVERVRTRRIEVLDEDDNSRITLSADQNEASITLWDTEGQRDVELSLHETPFDGHAGATGSLCLYDPENGRLRVCLSTGDLQRIDPGLYLYDKTPEQAWRTPEVITDNVGAEG